MNTHNICFCREIRKILCGYPLLYVAMINDMILSGPALFEYSSSTDEQLM